MKRAWRRITCRILGHRWVYGGDTTNRTILVRYCPRCCTLRIGAR